MTTPIEVAALAVDSLPWDGQRGGVDPGNVEIARAVFESIDRGGLARALAAHKLESPNGGTASESWCQCSCGERNAIPGGPRDLAEHKAHRHVADAILTHLTGGDR